MQVNGFSETLSLAENSLSLAEKFLELSPQSLSLDEIKSYENLVSFQCEVGKFCPLRSFKNIFSTFLLKIFRNHGFGKKI